MDFNVDNSIEPARVAGPSILYARHLFVAATMALLAIFAPSSAEACSCGGLGDPWAMVAGTPVIFTGRVISVEMDGPTSPVDNIGLNGLAQTTFQVIVPWKGMTGPTVVLHTATDSAACGVSFSEGYSYTIFAYYGPDAYPPVEAGTLTTSLCTMAPVYRSGDAFVAPLHDLQPVYLTADAAAAPQLDYNVLRADAAFHMSVGNLPRAMELYSIILAAVPQDIDSLSDQIGRAS